MLIKTKLMLLFTFILILSTMFLIYYDINHNHERTLYRLNDMKQRNIVLNSLFQNRRNNMLKIADDYSLWDDLVNFSNNNHNTDWAEEYIKPILTIYNYDAVWVYDSAFTLRYQSVENEIAENLDFKKSIFTKANENRLLHFFYPADNLVMEMVAATIHPTNDDAREIESKGFLLFGKLYDVSYLANLENQTDYQIESFSVKEVSESDSKKEEIIIDIPLHNFQGELIHILRFKQENNFLESLQKSHTKTLIVLFLIALLFLTGVYFLFHFWMRKPLNTISESLQTGSIDKIHEVSKSNNEFGKISKMIISYYEQADKLQKETKARLAAKQKLIETTDLFYKIFQLSPDLIIISQNNQILEVNTAFIQKTGLSEDDLIGKNTHEISVFPEHFHANEITDNTLLQLAAKNPLAVLVSVEKIDFKQQKCKLYVMRDITEELQLEKKMIQAQKMEAISSLAAGIAHDFNNILNVIMGYTATLKETFFPNSEQYEKIQMIENASQRAQELVKQIVLISNYHEQVLQKVNLNSIIKQAVKFLRPSIPSTIEIKTNLSSPAFILAEPMQIHQLLTNLCTNAIHSIYPKHGKIEIDLFFHQKEISKKNEQSYSCLQIKDTGCGISEDIIPKIFDPYFSTKKEQKGLGLAIVKGIVERFDGLIEVESKPSKGTTFTIYFPPYKESVSKSDSEILPITDTNKTILFVEDEKDLLALFEESLLSENFGVLAASSSRKALDIYFEQKEHIDMIVTDSAMPEMSGIELIKKIRQYDALIPVILYSGFKTPEISASLEELQIAAFLLKPIIPAKMIAAIKEVIQHEKRKRN